MKVKFIKSFVLLLSIYLSTISIGLYVGADLINKIYVTHEIQPAVENPESPSASGQVFIYVLIMTAILLILIKLGLDFIIRIISILAIFFGIYLTLNSFIGIHGLILAILLMLLFYWKKDNILIINSILVLTISGIGAFLGASLALIPSLILLIALSIYDLIAVFVTKHMVTIAENVKGKFPFMFLIPVGKKSMGLGTGDLAIPLMFTISVLRDYSLGNSIITAIGGLLGITALFIYVTTKEKVTLPALPPICVGLILGFIISILFL